MNIKKLITLILSLLLICQINPLVFADDGLCIVTPLDGSVISNTQKTFEASIPAGKNPTNTFFYLDGKFIGDGGLSAAVTIEEDMYVGKHTLELRAVYDDGTGEIAVSDFTAALKQYVMDFEEYPNKVYEAKADVNSELTCLYDVNAALFNYGTLEVASGNGKGNSLIINKTKGSTLYAGNGSFMVPALGQKSAMVQAKEGRLVVEFDFAFKMGTNWATVLSISPFSKNGHNNFGINFVHNSGVVQGTNKTIASTDTSWHHAKAIFDLDTGKYNAWVDDTELPEGNIKFPDSALERDFYYYRIGVALSRADDGVFFDNIKVGKDGAMDDFNGISDVDFVTANGEIVTETETVSRDVQKLIVKSERAFNIDTIIPSNMEVKLGGKSVKITEAILSDDSTEIILTLDNQSPITDNDESYVSLSEKIGFAGGSQVGAETKYCFEFEPMGFVVKSVDFEKTGSLLFASSMLKDGDVIKANIDFQNVTSAPKKLTAVLVIKDGNKYVSLSAKDIEVPVTGDTDYEVTVSSSAIGTIENPEVYVMLLDSLNSGMYIDSYDLAK